MREWLRFHSATIGALLALLVVAMSLSLAMGIPAVAGDAGSPLPAQAIPLPAPGEDQDNDSYADGADLADGDLQVGIRLVTLDAGRDAEPYVLLGTQDDHWRTGAGAELEWRHVVDPDSLGHKAGSPAWQRDAIRTGAWWMSRPADGERIAIAETGRLGAAPPPGTHWPQTMWANVRDDRENVTLHIELRDAGASAHRRLGAWDVEVRPAAREARVAGGDWAPLGALQLRDGARMLGIEVLVDDGLPQEDLLAIAQRWAPTLRLDSEEAFRPLRGDLLERFHGFSRRPADLRTWDFAFNGGRDGYRLFLADFDGDRRTDHADARLMGDLLLANDDAAAVYAHVGRTTDDQVVVQYWFLYLYNYVLDAEGRDVGALRHSGDREFVQLTFPDLEAARNGTPSAAVFSQHYEGVRVEPVSPGDPPLAGGDLTVYVARGSHASYPLPGDDRRVRSSLTSIYDRFDGGGPTLRPGDGYTLELLGGQPWHAGYLWGPVTRYGRDLGVSAQPFLQHDFRYAFTDPTWWQASIHASAPDELEGLYGRAP